MRVMRIVRTLLFTQIAAMSSVGQPAGVQQPASERSRSDVPASQPTDNTPGSVLNPRLDAQQQVLIPLEGRWTARIERGAAADHAKQGKKTEPQQSSAAAVERRWVLDGAFLEESRVGSSADSAADADRSPDDLLFWGYDRSRARYSVVMLAGQDGHTEVLYGRWIPSTRTIVFRSLEPGTSPSNTRSDVALVLRLASDSEHTIEVYAGANRSSSAPVAKNPDRPTTGADPTRADPNGPEVDDAPPGVTKLPSMNVPEQPSRDAPSESGGVSLDVEHLLYRISYTRPDGERVDTGENESTTEETPKPTEQFQPR